MKKRVSAAIAAMALVFTMVLGTVNVNAAGYSATKEETDAFVQELAQYNPYGHTAQYGDEWWLINLARSGAITEAQKKAYYESVESLVKSLASGTIDPANPSDNARVVIALNAMNYDATDVAGYDLVKPLKDLSWLTSTTDANKLIFAILALNSGDYEIDMSTYVQALCAMQQADNGFDSGWGTDVDTTAAAIEALAPYYNTDATAKSVIDKAWTYIFATQQPDAGFGGWGNSSSDTTAIVIMAATSMGINPATDARFTVGGVNVMQALYAFYVADGKFLYDLTGGMYSGENDMSTYHSFQAFIAYDRLLNGQTSFYDMSDLRVVPEEPAPTPEVPAPTPEAPTPAPEQKSPKTGDNHMYEIYLLAAAAMVTLMIARKGANN